MAGRDLHAARVTAIRNAQQAVRAFAREPNVDNELAVAQACARVRMLDEQRMRDSGLGAGR